MHEANGPRPTSSNAVSPGSEGSATSHVASNTESASAGTKRRQLGRPAIWCALIVAIEAVIVLVGFGQGSAHLLGGDSTEYDRLAVNLAKHGVFSDASAPPYLPYLTRAPGYPAFVAVLYMVKLQSAVLVRIVQFALLAVLSSLVYSIASRLVSRRAAAIAAVLAATYTPLLWIATEHMTEVLATVGATLVVLLTIVARNREPASNWLWAGVGLTLALASYVRPDFAGLIVPLLIGVLLSSRGAFRSAARWRPAAIVTFTCLLVLAPWTIRNALVSDRFVPLAAGTGVSLYASARQYAGTFPYRDARPSDWNRFYVQVLVWLGELKRKNYDPRTQVELDARLTHEALKLMRHIPLSTVIKDLPRRIVYLWGASDFSPPGRRYSITHRFGLIEHALVFMLIAGGMVIRRRLLLRDWPLWMFAVYLTLLHLVFHVASRYTVPARPALFVYAGVAVSAILAWIARRRRAEGPAARQMA